MLKVFNFFYKTKCIMLEKKKLLLIEYCALSCLVYCMCKCLHKLDIEEVKRFFFFLASIHIVTICYVNSFTTAQSKMAIAFFWVIFTKKSTVNSEDKNLLLIDQFFKEYFVVCVCARHSCEGLRKHHKKGFQPIYRFLCL